MVADADIGSRSLSNKSSLSKVISSPESMFPQIIMKLSAAAAWDVVRDLLAINAMKKIPNPVVISAAVDSQWDIVQVLLDRELIDPDYGWSHYGGS